MATAVALRLAATTAVTLGTRKPEAITMTAPETITSAHRTR
ncbi:MAG TPA: hypothetical protein VFY14_16840 [Streptomyces sp.]|nr:hypothetical protein [Streptomyces sp.]